MNIYFCKSPQRGNSLKRGINRQKGFTLMELMIALMLGAIVIGSLFTITRHMSEETTNQKNIVEAAQRARVGMNLLKNDMQRAGMMVSPHPRLDRDSLVSGINASSGQHAFFRNSIVHLNRSGTNEFDSVILVGNFYTANTYIGSIDAVNDTIQIVGQFLAGDCQNEFHENYAFAHLFSVTGQTLDAKINDITETDSASVPGSVDCHIVLEPGELFTDGPGAFADGQTIQVAANQAVLYRVEPASGYRVLMRYFINYDGDTSLTNACDDTSFTVSAANLLTGKVVAEYVNDFDVWFRTVYRETNGNTQEVLKAHYHNPSDLGAEPFVPAASNVVVGELTPGAATSNEHLSCEITDGFFGPEHVRSAMIKLVIRGERTDMSVRMPTASMNSGILKHNVAPAPSGDVGVYRLRTLVSEVALPNITARMAAFQQVSPSFD